MFTLDSIGIILLFTVFCIEFIVILLHMPDKKLVKDMMANFSLGLCIIVVGLFEKGMALGFFTLVYHFAVFTPHLCWWLWIAGFLSCDFIHYVYHRIGHRTRLFWAAHVTHHSSEHF